MSTTRRGEAIVPPVIGLGTERRARRRPGVAEAELDFRLRRYVRSVSDLLPLAAPGSRPHDLDGEPVAGVAPEHPAGARSGAERRSARSWAARDTPPAPAACLEPPAPRSRAHASPTLRLPTPRTGDAR